MVSENNKEVHRLKTTTKKKYKTGHSSELCVASEIIRTIIGKIGKAWW